MAAARERMGIGGGTGRRYDEALEAARREDCGFCCEYAFEDRMKRGECGIVGEREGKRETESKGDVGG